MGDNLPAVDLGTGRRAVAISLGYMHTCAILDDGSVKCWGGNGFGQLGLGDAENRGDEPLEMGDALRTVDLGAGRRAAQIVAGFGYTCALLDDGSVKCWGDTSGYDALAVVGTDPFDMGDNLVAVNLGIGRRTVALAAGGGDHTCALLDDGSVKCWGFNDLGQLGLGDIENRGDEPGEMGDNLPAVDLGTRQRVTQVVAGWGPTCTLHDDRSLRCWGHHHGDEPGEMGENLPTVEVGF
jgi:alpha-tubulin suppressor-like RCC1 family protein